MKAISITVVFLFFFSFPSFSQIILVVDSISDGTVNKLTKTSSGVFKGQKNQGSMFINVGRVDSTYFIDIVALGDFGCLTKNSGKVIIHLVGGIIIECFQISETDCAEFAAARYLIVSSYDYESEIVWEILKDNFLLLSTIPIEKITLVGSKSSKDYIPNPSFKEFKSREVLIKHFDAIK